MEVEHRLLGLGTHGLPNLGHIAVHVDSWELVLDGAQRADQVGLRWITCRRKRARPGGTGSCKHLGGRGSSLEGMPQVLGTGSLD